MGSKLKRWEVLFCCLVLTIAAGPIRAEQTDFASDEEFVSIFDGETLEGWEGDPVYWRVENGILIGEITPETLLKRNSFLIWRGGTIGDFELKLEYRISEEGNSGINYRSLELMDVPLAMRGYQFDIEGGDRWTANNYEERGRTFVALRGAKTLIAPEKRVRLVELFDGFEELQDRVVKKEEWNTAHLIVRGAHHQHYLNGVLMNELWDHDTRNGPRKGLLGVQVHVGPPMTVEYRNLRLARLDQKQQDAIETDPSPYQTTSEEIKSLLNYDTMESLKYLQDQVQTLLTAATASPIDGQTELTMTSPLHLVRSDLGRGGSDRSQNPSEDRDAVLIENETIIRIPHVTQEITQLGFDKTFEWKLRWSSEVKRYEILSVKVAE